MTRIPLLLALQDATPAVVPADTAWMLVSTALVLLMTPALAFFYGGLVRSKNSLNTMMMSFAALGVVGVTWALLAYTLAFADGNALIGGWGNALLSGVGTEAKGTIPHVLFMAFQGTFAIITAALISGAVVERMRFGPYLVFIALWTLLVYAPVAHWVWGGGWLMTRGVLDFAGGTVVHINAGVSALVAALVLGVRKDYARQAILPHNVPFTLLGAGLLWFGWFGFNGGSALAANELAALAFTNTFLAPMATLVVWVLLDYFRTGHATAVGGATGIVIGLVAITPAAGFVSPASALLLGALAAFPSYFTIVLRSRTRLDDSLDVFAGHGIGGMTGALLTGVFAQKAWNAAGADGLIAGNAAQLGIQALGVVSSIAYSAIMTFGILKLLALVTALRTEPRTEGVGMDVSQHGEEAYSSGEGSILVIPDAGAAPAPARALTPQTVAR
ncbi:MAG TPA: ammonium transporter [Gemmatimonadales bacterium]|nr:ammonium transporter [Gemmatimonadales bacterium]